MSGKRASMREGPLAALFRKTEEEGLEQRPADDPAVGEPASTPSQPAARERRPEPEPVSPPPADEDQDSDPDRSVPSPRDRLRHAFSSSIPENILDRGASAPSPAPRAPEPEPFPSAERDVFATPAPAGLPVLRVVGVGGAGVNAVNRMVEAEIQGIEFLAINTDLQSLHQSAAHATLHIGAEVTRGLGSGSNPDLGRQAAHGGVRQDQVAAQGRRHGVRRRRRRRRDRHRCRSGGGAHRPRAGRADRGHRHQAVRIRGRPTRRPGRCRRRGAGRRGRHADRRAQQPPAVGAGQEHLDGRRLQGGRRRAAPGRAGHFRPGHAAGPDQPRLRRRAHDHGRGRQRAAGHRHGHRRAPGDRGRRRRRSPRRCWRPAWRAHARSCCRSPAAATSRCGRSTRRPRRWPRPLIPTPTSSSGRWSTRSSTTPCGSPSWPPATATPRRDRRPACASRRASRGSRAPATATARVASVRGSATAPARAGGRARLRCAARPAGAPRRSLGVDELDVPEFMPRR